MRRRRAARTEGRQVGKRDVCAYYILRDQYTYIYKGHI